jgi:ribose-phosphate pyrophosphokinase
MSHISSPIIFAGNATPSLAKNVASSLGHSLGKACVSRFNDGELHIEIMDNVRGRDVFIVQSTCTPTNDHLMELILMGDALHRASAGRITAVIPYFGYARQDRRAANARVPISAKVIADLISSVGIDRVLTLDLHSEQIQGFFTIPVDNLYTTSLFCKDIVQQNPSLENTVIVSPDMGSVVRARMCAKRLGCELALIDKRRPQSNQVQIMNIIGSVTGKHCILVDDIVDTAGTLCCAAKALKQAGASCISAYISHPVLSKHSLEQIESSSISLLTVTDSIPLPLAASLAKIRVLSISPILSEAIRRIGAEESLSNMPELHFSKP